MRQAERVPELVRQNVFHVQAVVRATRRARKINEVRFMDHDVGVDDLAAAGPPVRFSRRVRIRRVGVVPEKHVALIVERQRTRRGRPDVDQLNVGLRLRAPVRARRLNGSDRR